jgi:flagellin-specific chaperone FliS
MKSGTERRAVLRPGADVGVMLAAARNEVEKRFLDGGAALLSVCEILNKLTSSLDRVTTSLDCEGPTETVAELRQTSKILMESPDTQTNCRLHFGILSDVGDKLRSHVSAMQETMRYLRTFAITVKITGAGVPEFGGFAQEILERIQSGTDEVNSFGNRLNTFEKDLKLARASNASTSKAYDATAPRLVEVLERDAKAIDTRRKELATIVRDVATIALGVQAKVATTQTALQIGDITRQRIEHVQACFTLLQETLDGDEGRKLAPKARQRLESLVHSLAAAQMQTMVENFQSESRNVATTIASFGHDTQELMRLRNEMQSNGANNNLLRTLEDSVSLALGAAKQNDSAHLLEERISQTALDTASSLLQSIEAIRMVKTDIDYMALNTNLRCSKMGEEGRSIKVVTSELRIYAAKLDESADAIVTGLTALETAAGSVGSSNEHSSRRLDERLKSVAGKLRASTGTEEELPVLAEHGRELATAMLQTLGKLDFETDLGEMLTDCANSLSATAGAPPADVSDLGEIVARLGVRIFDIYTTAQEREVHRDIIPAAAPAAPLKAEPRKKGSRRLLAA